MKLRITALLLLALLGCAVSGSGSLRPMLNVSWDRFLSRHDLIYDWTAVNGFWSSFYSGAWGGNGCLGYVLFARSPQVLTFVISRVDIYDDRNPSMPSFMNNFVYDQPRLPIADVDMFFLDTLRGTNLTVTSGSLRTVLHNGSLVGEVLLAASSDNLTDLCSVQVHVVVSPTNDANGAAAAAGLISVHVSSRAKQSQTTVFPGNEHESPPPCGPSVEARFSLQPHLARSTWWNQDASYVPNPDPLVSNGACSDPPAGGERCSVTTSLQMHLNGTAHATGIAVVTQHTTDMMSCAAYITITGVVKSSASALQTVHGSLNYAIGTGFPGLASATANLWNLYWSSSGGFLTFHDTLFEGFYFIQLFKFRCAVRPNGTVHDLQGPWFYYGTDWPDLHWDMNVQQAHFLVMTGADRLDLGRTFVDYMTGLATSGQLRRNTRPAWTYAAAAPAGASSLEGMTSCYWDHAADCLVEPPTITGNLLWATHVVELFANYSADSDRAIVIRDDLWPLLTGALSSYHYFQNASEPTGSIHLPPTFSPEYPGPRGPDCNYDVSLYRWGLERAVKYADRYNLSHPLLDDFRRSWAQLTFMPIDPQTSSLEVYRGIPFTIPHRHYSHLFSVWPLHIGDMRDPWWHGVAQRSVDVWLNNPASDSEFFRPVASKMSTLLNRAGAAYGNISTLINNVFFVHSNTFYGESGGPCTETPYAAAWAVSELLLQSWNSSLDFFPAVPDVIEVPTKRRPLESDENDDDGNFQLAGLAGASFFRLRTMGGFLASAIRTIEATNATHIVSTTSMLAVERAPSLKHVRRGVDTQIVLRTSMARPLRAVNCDSLAIIDDVFETGDDYVALGLAQSVQCVVLLPASSQLPTSFFVNPSRGNETFFNFWGFPDRRIW